MIFNAQVARFQLHHSSSVSLSGIGESCCCGRVKEEWHEPERKSAPGGGESAMPWAAVEDEKRILEGDADSSQHVGKQTSQASTSPEDWTDWSRSCLPTLIGDPNFGTALGLMRSRAFPGPTGKKSTS
jgi:hypothetical protein